MSDVLQGSQERWPNRQVTMAILTTLEMFSQDRYSAFLTKTKPGQLNKEWFDWFVGEWSVARTVSKIARESVRSFLDNQFRADVATNRDGRAVDRAAKTISDKGWGAVKRADGKSSLPVSLVSKIAFFLKPDVFIPYDSTALRGINCLRGTKKNGGQGRLAGPSYREYLQAFERVYVSSERQISIMLREPWVKAVSTRLGLDPKVISRPTFRRKVVDNLLMQLGGS